MWLFVCQKADIDIRSYDRPDDHEGAPAKGSHACYTMNQRCLRASLLIYLARSQRFHEGFFMFLGVSFAVFAAWRGDFFLSVTASPVGAFCCQRK